jgi:tetratricopeptide (TPR) repeat protein
MALLNIAMHAGAAVPGARSLTSELSRLTLEAQDAGLAPEVATGFYLLSFHHHIHGDYAAAYDDTLKAAEAGRTGDAATAARALGNTGRCLALIERELPRAESLLREAHVLASQAKVNLKDIPWGLGLIAAFRGEYKEAAAQLDAALVMAQAEQDHWAECLCLQRLALIEIEGGDPESARARVHQLAQVAAKMGEGSERPVADALRALADCMLGDAAAGDRVDQAISRLRNIDAKALLARVLTIAATIDLQRGHQLRAAERAQEARRVAEAVGHRSEAVMAQVLLARAARDRGDAAEAKRWLDLSARDLAGRDVAAAYVHRAFQDAAAPFDSR